MTWKQIAASLLRGVLDRLDPEAPVKAQHLVVGSPQIMGSYPPLAEYYAIGSPDDYFIHSGYQSRLDNTFFDDSSFEDEWQREVYQFAREIADREQLNSVFDIGCGSGFKLMKYFADRSTVGLDLEPTVRKLKERYPDRMWMACDFSTVPRGSPDLVICSDVIEHLVDPNPLLAFIQSLAPRYVIFSTPERNLLRVGSHDGPPCNTAHVREWSMPEFRAYVESAFEVMDHFISNSGQCTQCLLARPHAGTGGEL
jgi:SAM-dependent methyltransferase